MAVLLVLAATLVPGERLDYDLRYGPVTLGTLSLVMLEMDTLDSVPCYHLRADLELTRSMSWLFWAQYRLESWCRASDMVTLKDYKRTREPKYRAEWTASFEPESGLVRYSDGRRFELPDSARDMLTLWYYFRTLALSCDDTVRLNCHSDRRNYHLAAAVTGSKSIRTAAGTFDCVAVNPSAGTPLGTVYLTDDERRIPAVIRARLSGLVVTAVLREVSLEEER